MVLHHVTNSTRFLVVGSASFQSDILCHSNLYVVNITPVPHRLEDAICQAKNKNILYCFFAEIMIDAIDLLFFEDPGNLAVQFACRYQVMPKRLFNDDARPAFAVSIQAHRAKTLDDIRILTGWC